MQDRTNEFLALDARVHYEILAKSPRLDLIEVHLVALINSACSSSAMLMIITLSYAIEERHLSQYRQRFGKGLSGIINSMSIQFKLHPPF